MTDYIQAFAWCMLQVTLFAAVAAVGYGLLRAVSARGNVALLVVSLCGVVLLTFLCFSSWPRWSWPEAASMVEVLPGDPIEVGLSPAAGPIAESLDDALMQFADVEYDAIHQRDTARPIDVPTEFASAGPVASRSVAWRWVVAAVGVAWILSAFGLAKLLAGFVHVRRYRRGSTVIDDEDLLRLLDGLRDKYQIKRPIELRESPQLGVAALVGWRRPLVLLPKMWRRWSADQQRAVLAHELAHVAQRHFPAWLLAQAAVVAHYYHPFVHWLTRRLRLEQELAADRLAAAVFGDRQRYAAMLAGLALGPAPPSPALATLGLFMSRPFLMRRIAMLRRPAPSADRSSRILYVSVLTLLAMAAFGVAGLRGPSETAHAEQPAAADEDRLAIANESDERGDGDTVDTDGNEAQTHVATALFRVSRRPLTFAHADVEADSDESYQVLQRTIVVLATSDFVLQSALRNAEVASLPMIRSERDPVAWLRRQIAVTFVPGSEIMVIEMGGMADEVDQIEEFVNAVANAFLNEVVYADRRRQLQLRDALSNSFTKFQDDLRRKMEEFHDISRELGSLDDGRGQLLQQLDLQRLERIETELMRLEDEQLNAMIEAEHAPESPEHVGRLQFFEQRLEQLHERQEELEEQITSRSETSVDLVMRQRELQHLQAIDSDMRRRLELMDINRESPDRIIQLQAAVVNEL